ncbi:hypothetical protein FRB99_000298 [Tulasnella sp. 403]|nr:hypothetical protein FRB99_000298 [Tulasnella sp. 403]
MKAQPSTSSTSLSSTRARVNNTVYPPPNRRVVSSQVSQSQSTSSSQPSLHAMPPQRVSNLSPKSLVASSISKRRGALSPRAQYAYAHRTSSYSAASATLPSSSASSLSSRRTPPPPLTLQHPLSKTSHARLAHQRALIAQRNAAFTQKAAVRDAHISSLDRGIQLLLEEEYREEVKAWMLEKEKLTMASAAAMDQQPELQWHMRSHLLDFLLEIHVHFRLRPETLYLTLNILDRYVSRRIVYKKHYQLVGCVSLWLAAKFEDAKERVPSVKDLKELCHNAYEEGAFVQMEGHVLGTVDWDLGTPTAESWLRVLCTETYLPSSPAQSPSSSIGGLGMFGGDGDLSHSQSSSPAYSPFQAHRRQAQQPEQPFEDTRTQHVARFLMEMTLYSRDYIQFPPSVLALGSLCLARYICGKGRRPADESPEVLHLIYLLDHTLSQNLESVSQILVKKYSFVYYSKASGVVVSFYLRGGRFPLGNFVPPSASANGVKESVVEKEASAERPESLVTNVVSVEDLRRAAKLRAMMQMTPVTPVRDRYSFRWGSGQTDLEETPGLIRSDSSSSYLESSEGMEVDADAEMEMDETMDHDEDVDATGDVFARTTMDGHSYGAEVDDEDDDEDDETIDSEDEEIPAAHPPNITATSSSMSLTVPSATCGHSSHTVHGSMHGGLESLPITPTTPMFQLDPFGSAQAHAEAQLHGQQVAHASHGGHSQVGGHSGSGHAHTTSKDKENLVPSHLAGVPLHPQSHVQPPPCNPMVSSNVGSGVIGVVDTSGDEVMGNLGSGEYRQALLAIVP